VKTALSILSYFAIPLRSMKATVEYHRLSMTTVENLGSDFFSVLLVYNTLWKMETWVFSFSGKTV